MTPLATLVTGIAVGAVSTWLYERNVTIPRVRRNAKAETADPVESVETPASAEESTPAEGDVVQETKRAWRIPGLRRTQSPAPDTQTEPAAPAAQTDAVDESSNE